MTHPLLSIAAEDHELPSSAVRVLVFLSRRLNATEPEPVKVWGVAVAVDTDRETVARSLDLLSERGYIVPGPRDGRYRTYMLGTDRAA